MREPVETHDAEGVDFGWVMQVTFVATLPTWSDKALFAVRVGAVVWFLTAVAVYLYARRQAD
jgi:hypothetical protein